MSTANPIHINGPFTPRKDLLVVTSLTFCATWVGITTDLALPLYRTKSVSLMKSKIGITLLALLCYLPIFSARVDTIQIYSPSMKKQVKTIVITPDKALGRTPTPCPVVYLLHGYGDNAKAWLNIKPDLPQIADAQGLIVICPDGKNSWYWDSPKQEDCRYETFVSTELTDYIDAHYPTLARREGRAISGLSMGGHGALWIAFRHKDRFGACGSSSGGVDIRPFPLNWEMSKQLGEYAHNKAVWDAHTVINQIHRIENKELDIIIDCGEGDFFLEVNKDLHTRLQGRGIDHDFIVRPGVHNRDYWNNAIDYQLLFFKKFFERTAF